MFRLRVLLAIFAPLSTLVYAQTPLFDAAEIRVSPPSPTPTMRGGSMPGGLYQLRNATMLDLIMTAWGIDGDSVYGGPSWIATDRFDITATASPSSTPPEHAQMLRSLLISRFGLVVHTDQKPLPVFLLSAGKRHNPRLKAASGAGDSGCRTTEERNPTLIVDMTCHNVVMAVLAGTIRELDDKYFNHQMVDATGLRGPYDLELKWTPYWDLNHARLSGAASGQSIYDALDKQLGLKLEAGKQPMPVVVVDSVNRVPKAEEGSQPVLTGPTEFEVADVKVSKTDPASSRGAFTPGGVDFRGATLQQLVAAAWDFDPEMITGGPKWFESDRFDIIAKAPAPVGVKPVPLTTETLRQMLQSLLKQRFHLAFHREDQPAPAYLLTVGKRGLKMKEADPANRSECKIGLGEIGATPVRVYTCQNTTMTQFASTIRHYASLYIEHPVVDLTELKGSYDFAVSFIGKNMLEAAARPTEDGAPNPAAGLTVFEAIDRQMGLKLDLGKHPLPTLVVDHAEQLPAGN